MTTKAELPAPYSSVEVVTQTDLWSIYLWLKDNYSVSKTVVLARLGEIVFYAKLPRRNDATGRLVFGFASNKFSVIHWHRSSGVAPALSNCWDREARVVLNLQSTIDAALALKELRRAA